MKLQRLPPDKWRHIQELVPIACVDILPIQLSEGDHGILQAVGLIMRETPHQGVKWCLVGGRLFRNESFAEAINREIRDALGSEVHFKIKENVQPDYVAEYFTEFRQHGGYDPRQHAIGLTFCIPIQGNISAQGEALSFAWFVLSEIPAPDQFGFNQDQVVGACLARLANSPKPSNTGLQPSASRVKGSASSRAISRSRRLKP